MNYAWLCARNNLNAFVRRWPSVFDRVRVRNCFHGCWNRYAIEERNWAIYWLDERMDIYIYIWRWCRLPIKLKGLWHNHMWMIVFWHARNYGGCHCQYFEFTLALLGSTAKDHLKQNVFDKRPAPRSVQGIDRLFIVLIFSIDRWAGCNLPRLCGLWVLPQTTCLHWFRRHTSLQAHVQRWVWVMTLTMNPWEWIKNARTW